MEDIRHECGEGWIALIEDAKRIVNQYNLEHPDQEFPLEFTQIKEKFGGLRLYINQYVPEVSKALRNLEEQSYNICEHCGTNENVTTNATHNWIMTLCNKCREKEIKQYNERYA